MPQSSTTTNYAEIQQNEIEALRSIFMDDFVEEKAKAAAWNKKADPQFCLRLRASSTDSLRLSLSLHVSFPTTYPKSLPHCQILYDDTVGKQTRELIDELVRRKLKELLGTEAIYEVATSVQEALEDAAQATTGNVHSLDELRASQEAHAQQRAEEEEVERLQQQRNLEEEQTRTLSMMVEQELARQAKSQKRQQLTVPSERSDNVGHDAALSFDREIRARNPGDGSIVAFRSVVNKTLYRQGSAATVYTANPEGSEQGSRPFLALKECKITSIRDQAEAVRKKELQALEAHLENLQGLPGHPNILPILGFRVRRTSDMDTDQGWDVGILTDLMPKGSVQDLLETVGRVDTSLFRSWAVQIIEGLDFLHRHRIVHGRLGPENILLERSQSGETVIKLADALYQHDLHSMKEIGVKFSSAASAYWFAPEAANSANTQPTSPRDVWDLGVLMLQLLFGWDVRRAHASPGALLEDLDLTASLVEMLSRTFRADPRKRPTCFNLLPSSFLRSNEPIFERGISSALSRVNSATFSASHSVHPRHNSTHAAAAGPSRYANDFLEAGRIGKGGFGEVVRARNKLDGQWYAIKKIVSESPSALNSLLVEVMLLSRLNNIFIVRYYTAWLEDDPRAGPVVEAPDQLGHSSTGSDSSASHIENSGRGLDFISSGGFPRIEFGYDGEDEDEDDEDDEGIAIEFEDDQPESVENATGAGILSPKRMPIQRRRSSVPGRVKSTLYIQMELCENQTLRDLIRGDLPSDVEEGWRLFHQITSALAYVHSNGIIHRDLKPENIFVTRDRSIRLGDFGLAKPHSAPKKGASGGVADPTLTVSIGTSLYLAPEVRSVAGGSYDEKADMYSLGIILFEMSYPLKITAMERAQILGALRQEQHTLPSAFEEPEKVLQGEIIQELINHKPGERPSSQVLLTKIPSQVEDELINRALQALSGDQNSSFYSKLIGGIFVRPAQNWGAKDYTYDLDATRNADANGLLLQSVVKDQLVAVFRRHGAVETRRPLLLPSSHYYRNAVRLMNPAGQIVQLPYDGTLLNARMLAKQPQPAPSKTFAFGAVFRENTSCLQHPRSVMEVDFDVVSKDSFDMAVREAECIKVVDEVIETLPSLARSPMCFQITHARLLDVILQSCGIEASKSEVVKQTLSMLNIGPWTFARIRAELRSPGIVIPSTALDDLMRFDFRDTYEAAIPRLRALLENTDELESTFRHLGALTEYLDRFGVKRKVYISPLSCFNDKFYQGNVMFQCVFDTKRRKVFCAGGRYDRLIQEHRAGVNAVGERHAVGFNLAWESIMESLTRSNNGSSKAKPRRTDDEGSPWHVRRCDVLIDSIDPATLRSSGIKIVQDLWANDINAELVIDSDIQESTSYQNREENSGHDWIVLIKQDETLKVRSTVRREDCELRRSELVNWLRSEIRDRDRQEGRTAERTRLRHEHSHTESAATERDADVRVLQAQNRTKKSNRRNIVEDAQARAAELAQSFLDGPIAAVETKDDIFEGLRDTRLSDPESWRRFVQSAPLGERQYLNQVHELLLDMAKGTAKGARNAFVYNFRSRACILYDLWGGAVSGGGRGGM